ncbi:MAG: energy transducer TonB [Candidatus Acidiferrales bacterium]|jgi:TonB family protein
MRTMALGCLLLCAAGACFGQEQPALCPKHIEAPDYPQIARTANITGTVVVLVTIDSDGKVTDAQVTGNHKWVLLERSAVDNIRLWTFAKPPSAPYTETIAYDYELDPSLPGDDGRSPITRVNFDLPDRVTILANLRVIDHT